MTALTIARPQNCERNAPPNLLAHYPYLWEPKDIAYRPTFPGFQTVARRGSITRGNSRLRVAPLEKLLLNRPSELAVRSGRKKLHIQNRIVSAAVALPRRCAPGSAGSSLPPAAHRRPIEMQGPILANSPTIPDN